MKIMSKFHIPIFYTFREISRQRASLLKPSKSVTVGPGWFIVLNLDSSSHKMVIKMYFHISDFLKVFFFNQSFKQSQTSLAQLPVFSAHQSFLPFFLWCKLLRTESHQSPLVGTIPLPPSRSHAPIHELILLMSGQCTNPGPPYPCPVCLCRFRKSQ